MLIILSKCGSVHLNERIKMNKENQKKYKEYQKLAAKQKKANAKVEAALEKCRQINNAYAIECAKLDKKWKPRIEAANKAEAAASNAYFELANQCKELRKGFVAQDNPNRKELIDLILS